MKKSKNKKIILYFLIPLVLLGLGFFLALIFNNFSFSTLSYVQPKSIVEQNPQRYLIKGDKIIGEFKASEAHLGVVSLRFEKSNGVNFAGSDRFNFKIREASSKTWFYQGIYPIDQFDREFVLPFGFPLVDSSKGKDYVFEIDSLYGNGINSAKLSNKEPVVLLIYKFSKSEYLSSPMSFMNFLYKKSISSITNTDFLFSSTLYFLPLFFYLLWILVGFKTNVVKRFLFYCVIIFMLFDSFIIQDYHAGIIMGLLGLWIVAIFIYKFESSISYFSSLVFTLLLVSVIFLKLNTGQEKLGIYIYGFFIIATFQAVLEMRIKPRKSISLSQFLNELKFK